MFSRLCSERVVISVPTSAWVSRAASRCSQGMTGQGGGQIVTYLLQALRQVGVVQGKASPIFDHAQSFPGAIGGRVEDSEQGHLVGNMLGIHNAPY